MTADGGFESPVSAAARRLEDAVERLRARLAARPAATHDASDLSAQLAAARARERELEDAGAQASAALAQAIGEIRAALSAPVPGEGD